MSCRICFESEGPLCTPCRCDGSIKYIHEKCLLKWVLVTDRSACELCKETYAFDYNRPLEKDSVLGPLRHYFLVNPSWHIAAFCSFIIIIQRYFQFPPTKHLFIKIQLVYHSSYLGIGWLYCRSIIQHWPTYLHEITHGHGRYVLLIHGSLLTLLLILSFITALTNLVFLCVANQCFLGVYPILHSMTVQAMNKSRTIIIKNRDSR
jgi:hypothetical protein